MAFSKVTLFLLACALFLSSYQVHCNENEDSLLNGINTYRKNLNLTALKKHDKASCLADEIADGLEDRPCSAAADFSGERDTTGAVAKLVDFPKILEKCGVDANTTTDGAILPTCTPSLIESIIIGNYTHSKYAKYLNDTKFSGAGIGSDDDWIVVVLTTNKPSGSFSGDRNSSSSSSAAPAYLASTQGLTVVALGLASLLL